MANETTTPKPDGYCTWHPEEGYQVSPGAVEGPYEHYIIPISKKGVSLSNWDKNKGWQIKPVCLIEPGRLARLEALEAWARNMREYLLACPKNSEHYEAEMQKVKNLDQILPVTKMSRAG